jgi:hypothetical protein
MAESQSQLRLGNFPLPLPRGCRFLLGGVSAALVVLTLAGAGLRLAAGGSFEEPGYYRLPPPVLSLARPPVVPLGATLS